MQDTTTTPRVRLEIKVERPRLHKVILVNDDFTPREFVTTILKAEFRLGEEQARRVMMTAHQRGVCVVGVFTREIAEDGDAVKELALDGLSTFVRSIIKGYKHDADVGGSTRARQLEMFDERLHPLVIEIDREAVFVPSRDEYVELTPDAMTPREMREAGTYLVAKGRDCISRGETLMRLADAMSVE